jgi:hypothetical protein
MNWLQFLKRFVVNLVVAGLIGTLLVGLIGFLLAGKQGLINGAGWGLLFGILSGLSVGLLLALQPGYWEDFAGRLAGWWVKHKEPDAEEDPERELGKK